MKSDRELLELAAKAVGVDIEWRRSAGAYYYDDPETGREEWTPLYNDGQAFWLAVELGLVVCVMRNAGFTGVYLPACSVGGKYDEVQHHGNDAHAATRRSIVLAAASIGESME